MQSELSARLDEAVPRYTSYPTTPHFSSAVTSDVVERWVTGIPRAEPVSLYIHIPFCDRLCWFCACHTKQTRRYEPVAYYLTVLHQEIRLVSELLNGQKVRAVHLGGGSPTILTADDIIRLGETLRSRLPLARDAAISVEIDPNDMDVARLDAFCAIGMTRASLGIQDFDSQVQRAINRPQSFEITRAVVQDLRASGVPSINFDLLYGLPHQTVASIKATVDMALSLAPDRIALFGYAHVPWFKKHQTMIDGASLPKASQRLEQSLVARQGILAAGYESVGHDHFALPNDPLAVAARTGHLRRNFQGYTDESCATVIGMGPSSISSFRNGYAQNHTAMSEYARCITEGRLATARGVVLTEEDRLRSWVIERLMCEFSFSCGDAVNKFGEIAQAVLAQAEQLERADCEHLFVRSGDRYVVSEKGKPFVRTIAARFDQYLEQGQRRHSKAV
ncbi:oxygen-independent coproporphyrinogen III oxidase [soil metagenome]